MCLVVVKFIWWIIVALLWIVINWLGKVIIIFLGIPLWLLIRCSSNVFGLSSLNRSKMFFWTGLSGGILVWSQTSPSPTFDEDLLYMIVNILPAKYLGVILKEESSYKKKIMWWFILKTLDEEDDWFLMKWRQDAKKLVLSRVQEFLL